MPDAVMTEPTSGLLFGSALYHLRNGRMVQRAGWNGKGMFLFIRPPFECNEETFMKIVSVPENVKIKIVNVLVERLQNAMDESGESGVRENLKMKFTPYISMFAADGSIVNGWLASQTDMLAEDWQIVE